MRRSPPFGRWLHGQQYYDMLHAPAGENFNFAARSSPQRLPAPDRVRSSNPAKGLTPRGFAGTRLLKVVARPSKRRI